MKKNHLLITLAASAALGGLAGAQTFPNPIPARILGDLYPNATLEDVLQFRGTAPNGVEGRELNSPLGVAVDTSGPEPIVYVVDTENNRVLGWKRKADLHSGQRADIVIGQRDFYSTWTLGGTTILPQGLYYPTSAVCDSQGNLFVYDVGNNRILRYPKPFEQTTDVKTADLVIGQTALVARNAQGQLLVPGTHNQGLSAPNQTTLRSATRTSSAFTPYFGTLAFDRDGNLWATDPGNHRVLRYPAARVNGPSNTGDGGTPVEAELVLGQADYNTAVAGSGSTSSPAVILNNRTNKARIRFPSAVAADSSGNVFVSDDLSRVLVYRAPLWSGKEADRVMGLVVTQGNQTVPAVNETGFAIEVAGTTLAGGPRGMFTIGDQLFVIDSAQNRIMRFDPVANWPLENIQYSPRAVQVIGQVDLFNAQPNRGWLEPWTNTLWFPTAATAAGAELFVADSLNNRVLVLPNPTEAGPNTEATLVLGQASFEFRSPNLTEGREFASGRLVGVHLGVATALDESGETPRLYVADPGNNRILGYSDARKIHEGGWAELVIGQVDFWRSLVNSPTGEAAKATETGLQMPSAVAVDSDGNLWVADTGNGRVVRYPRPFDNPGGPHIPDIVIGKPDANSRFNAAVNETNLLYPVSIAFTNDGHLVVADPGHNRVLVFRKDFSSGMAASLVLGQPDYTSSTAGPNPEMLNFPLTVATDTSDRIYVGDYGNGQLKIFPQIWALAPGSSPGLSLEGRVKSQFRPNAVTVSRKTGIIYVVDGASSRVVLLPDFSQILSTEITNNNAALPISNGVGGRHITLDKSDNLILTDASNRVTFHYPQHIIYSYGNGVDKIAPGGLAVLQTPGVKFAETPVGEPTAPLPRSLNGIEVLVNGVPAPLRRLDDDKIQLQVPSGTPYNTNVEFRVRNVDTWQVLSHQWMRVEQMAPAFIAANGPGGGQVRALNQNGSPNSSANPAERTQEVTLFLTGYGAFEGLPEDGTASEVQVPFDGIARVILGTQFVEIVSSTLDPSEPGVWRVKVKVHNNAAPGNNPLVMEYQGRRSNTYRNGQIISPTFNTVAVR